MKRSLVRTILSAALLAAALRERRTQADPETTTDWPGVHLLQGGGGNVLACAGDSRLLLIDADDGADGRQAARGHGGAAGQAGRPGGRDPLALRPRRRLRRPGRCRRVSADDGPLDGAAHLGDAGSDVRRPPGRGAAADLLGDTLTLRWGDETVGLRHMARHTGGDLVVHLHRADVVHAGDLFFNCGYPTSTPHGGSIDGASRRGMCWACAGPARIVWATARPPGERCAPSILRDRRIVAAEEGGRPPRGGCAAAAALDERGAGHVPAKAFIIVIRHGRVGHAVTNCGT
jgi:hypothetical protein